MHEASLYMDNCFITLTYNDEHLPAGKTLVKADFQKFMKRLRKQFGKGIRYFHCGEYGDVNGRPHYHACIFNFDFPDRRLYKLNNGFRIDTSEILDQLWSDDRGIIGLSTVGDVTFQSAAYVARYVMKKITGDKAAEHYGNRLPEYCTMSRRPGIGRVWYDKFKEDVYPSDGVVVNGKEVRPPRFYDNSFEIDSPEEFARIRAVRKRRSKARRWDQTSGRLRVREVCLAARLSRLKRETEFDE
jgi:hypothetical protein